jgi:hypothetical protein
MITNIIRAHTIHEQVPNMNAAADYSLNVGETVC